MAKKGKNYTKIAGTWEQIKPSYNDLEDVPASFTPTAHEHTLSDITDVNAPSPSDGEALVWDNSTSKWVPGAVSVDTSDKVSKAGDTMTGALTFSGLDTRINFQEDHFVFRRFDSVVEAVTNQTTAYILLCRNAGGNDVNGTITMDRTSGLRHASTVDILVSAGSSATPVGTVRSMATAGSAGTSYDLVTLTYAGNVHIALRIYNPDSYYDTSGMYFTGRIKTTDPANEFLMLPASSVSGVTVFSVNESHQIDGNTIYHTGNIPNYALSVNGETADGSGDINLILPNASDYVAKSGDTMTGNLLFANGANRTIRLGSATNYYYDIRSINDDFGIYETSSIPRLYIKYPNGNVGISTDAPGYNLDVYKNSADVNPTFRLQNAATNAGSGINLSGNNNAANSLIWHNGAADALMFQTNTATYDANKIAMTIDSSQNVGIGETAPLGRLHTKDGNVIIEQGDLYIASSANAEGGENGGGSGTPAIWFSESEGTSVVQQGFGIRYDGDGQSGAANRLEFVATDIKMVIQNGGNVGIGTESPSTRLSLNQAGTDVSDGLWIYEADNPSAGGIALFKSASKVASIQSLGGDSSISFITNDAGTNYERMRINDVGNVGIGKTSPATKLDVAGVIRSFQGSGGMTLSGYGTPDFGYLGYNYYNNNGTEAAEQSARDSWRIRFGNGATKTMAFGHRQPNAAAGTFTEYMTIANSGNVGIGTTNAETLLSVGVGSVASRTPIGGSSISLLAGGYASTGAGSSIELGNGHGDNGTIASWIMQSVVVQGGGVTRNNQLTFSTRTAFGNTVTERMRITSGGNVGIGTESPDRKLDVNGGIWTRGSEYNRFDTWTDLTGYHGLYSSVHNSAHFYPNNSTYGAWKIQGTRNGWGGLEFLTGANGNVSLMIGNSGNVSGFHNNAYGWQWRWESGTAYVNKGTYGAGTQATVWDSVNLSKSLTYTTLGSITMTTGSVTMSTSPSNGLATIVTVEIEAFSNAGPATWTGPLYAMSGTATYKNSLWLSSTKYGDFYRNSTGTQIYFSSAPSNTVYSAKVYELKVA